MTSERASGFRLLLPDLPPIPVERLAGEEAVSRPFRFELTATLPDDLAPDRLVGRPARLEVAIGGIGRGIEGAIGEIEALAGTGGTAKLVLVPRLALAAAPDIAGVEQLPLGAAVSALLDGESAWELRLPAEIADRPVAPLGAPRPGESVLDSLGRLLAGSGAEYVFDPAAGGALAVIDARSARELPPAATEADPAAPGLLALKRSWKAGPGGVSQSFAGQSDRGDLAPGCVLPLAGEEAAVGLWSVRHAGIVQEGGVVAYTNQFFGGVPGEPARGRADDLPAGEALSLALAEAFASGPSAALRPAPLQAGQAAAGTVWYKVWVPDYDGAGNKTYLRLGSSDTSFETTSNGLDYNTGQKGWYLYTDGDFVQHVKGDIYIKNEGGDEDGTTPWLNSEDIKSADPSVGISSTVTYDDKAYSFEHLHKVGGEFRKVTKQIAHEATFSAGDKEEFFTGFGFDGKVGFDTGVAVGGKMEMFAGCAVESNVSLFSVEHAAGYKVEFTSGSDEEVQAAKTISAGSSIELMVGGVPTSVSRLAEDSVMKGLTAANLVAVTTALGAGIGMGADAKWEDSEAGTGVGIAAASAAMAGYLALGLAYKLKQVVTPATTETSKVIIQPGMIQLTCGIAPAASTIKMTPTDITLMATNVSLTGAAGPAGTISLNTAKTTITSTGGVTVTTADFACSGKGTFPTLTSPVLSAMTTQLGDAKALAESAAATAKTAAATALATAKDFTTQAVATLAAQIPKTLPKR